MRTTNPYREKAVIMSKSLPLHDLHANAGADFIEVNGWTCPHSYGDAGFEYRNAYQRSALFDFSNRGKVRMSGKEAIQFLNNFCTNDIINLQPGHGCEAFLTTAKGRLIAPLYVSRLARPEGDELLLDTSAGLSKKIIEHLSKYRITEQVEFTDQTNELIQLHLCGPESAAAAQSEFGESTNELTEFQHVEPDREGDESLMVRRHDYLNLPGFDVLCSVDQAPQLWTNLINAGATPAGMAAYEMLRTEAGVPRYGREMDEDRLVTEIGRTEQAICYTKGCYLGQETIVMARDRGQVNRKLMGLKLTGKEAASANAVIKSGDTSIGNITSSEFSPRLDQAIALAYLKRGHQTPGTEVAIESEGNMQTGVVCELPIIR